MIIIKFYFQNSVKKEPLVRITWTKYTWWREKQYGIRKKLRSISIGEAASGIEIEFGYKYHFESKDDGFGMSFILSQQYCIMSIIVTGFEEKKITTKTLNSCDTVIGKFKGHGKVIPNWMGKIRFLLSLDKKPYKKHTIILSLTVLGPKTA